MRVRLKQPHQSAPKCIFNGLTPLRRLKLASLSPPPILASATLVAAAFAAAAYEVSEIG